MIAPPTPERLEQDKKSIEEQFDRAFSLVEQLGKDTEALKAAEQDRTERLDAAISDFESVINDLKSANRRRDDEAQRIRDDVINLKDAIPKAMETQKELSDQRLKEINSELTSLKTLISQRVGSSSSSASPTNGYLRPSNGQNAPQSPGLGRTTSSGNDAAPAEAASGSDATKPSSSQPTAGSGLPGGKASIPAWQMAMANKGSGSSTNTTSSGEAGASSQKEA